MREDKEVEILEAQERKKPAKIADLFGDFQKPIKKARRSERGELLEWIAQKIQKPIKQVAFFSSGLTVKDLYYIKSSMTEIEQRRDVVAARKWYWWSVRNND